MSKPYILALDQGTTSTRAILFDSSGRLIKQAQQDFPQHFPANGWVEHDPEDIWATTLDVCHRVIDSDGGSAGELSCVGITNQRETTVVWERNSGRPIYNAIVWQDRRTADLCSQLRADGLEQLVQQRTGLRLDPYFSATKIRWLLDNIAGARRKCAAGELAFGTIDSFLIWRLSGGKAHVTDATNASRTMLFDIHRQCWDEEILQALDIPRNLLPEVLDCAADFAEISPEHFGVSVPITGVAGDQQAALVGQACFEPGMTKSTYGTGCFMIANTGGKALQSGNQLLSTIAYRLKNQVTYGLEGSIFVAGSAVQWLRDGLHLIGQAEETESLAEQTGLVDDLFLVPAFTGLGAPHWDPRARGAILGLTRDTGVAEIVTATLQAVGYQSRDLLLAMAEDGISPTVLRIDGGMAKNNWLARFLADILGVPVERPRVTESTALGAAYLAGLQSGIYTSLEDLVKLWQSDQIFTPAMAAAERERLYAGWLEAVMRTRSDYCNSNRTHTNE